MTRAVVVFESMFGNSEVVARAIAEGLSDEVPVRAARATPDLVLEDDVELLVLGGPTHAFGMTRPATRESAGQQGASSALAKGIGVREWLDGLGSTTCRVATFDTRVHKKGLPGSAARGAEKRLGRAGARVLAPATSFWVGSTQGPLLPGEEGPGPAVGQRARPSAAAGDPRAHVGLTRPAGADRAAKPPTVQGGA